MKCITCSQPLPEAMKEHPAYFARYSLEPDENDPQDFTCEVDTILHYIQSLAWALTLDEKRIDENELYWLHQLIEDLSGEALRRLGLANDALDRRYAREHGQEEEQDTPSGNEEKVIRAERFELVDKKGRVQAVLGQLHDNEMGLRLLDARGNDTATFSIHEGSPCLYFSTGNIVLNLGLENKQPFIHLCDASGSPRLKLEVDDEDTPIITVLDADRKAVLELGADENEPFIYLCDKDRVCLKLNVDKRGMPTIVTSDAAGKETWRAPAEKEG